MKKRIFIAAFFLLFLGACTRVPSSYVFINPPELITSIDLLYNANHAGEGTDSQNIYLVRTLEDAEIIEFMEDIYLYGVMVNTLLG